MFAMEKLVEEYNQAMREMAAKNMDAQTFSVYWILKQSNVKNPEAVAAQVGNLLKHYPNWKSNAAELRALKAEAEFRRSNENRQSVVYYSKSVLISRTGSLFIIIQNNA